jgi:citrate lyase subunit gamma (acyl carrier protein)
MLQRVCRSSENYKIHSKGKFGGVSQLMKIKTPATAGTMESGDIMIEIESGEQQHVEVVLKSSVANEFGKQITQTIRAAANEYGLEYAVINAVDKGALDCTIRARVAAACQRATQTDTFDWGRTV